MTGTVKWFDQDKGFGFIKGDDGVDVFVHHSAIADQRGRRNLTENQLVEFEVENGERGPKAVNVRSVNGLNAQCPAHDSEHAPRTT